MRKHILKPQPYLLQLLDLTLLQLSNWRWSWKVLMFSGTILPLFGMFTFSYFARGGDSADVTYIYSGNIVLNLLLAYQGMVAGNFAYMKFTRMLSYFASLPIHRSTLILGTVGSFFVLLLPSLVIVIIGGAWLLDIDLAPHPLILIVVPLAGLPLAALGAVIGVSANRPENAFNLNRLITLPSLVLGPVFVPIEQLPPAVATLSWLSPVTYASSALRQVLLTAVTPRLWLDIAMLLIFTVLSLLLAHYFMDWRTS